MSNKLLKDPFTLEWMIYNYLFVYTIALLITGILSIVLWYTNKELLLEEPTTLTIWVTGISTSLYAGLIMKEYL